MIMDNIRSFRKAGLWLAYPAAYLYLRLLLHFPLENKGTDHYFIGAFIFVLIFIAFNEIVRRGRGKDTSKKTYFWYGVMGLTAITVNIAPSMLLSYFALHLCAVYSVLISGNILYEGKTGSFIVSDLLNGGFAKTFPNFGNIIEDIKESRSNAGGEKKTRNAKGIVAGIVMIVILFPMFITAIFLLSEINAEFNNVVNDILSVIDLDWLLHLNIGSVIVRLIFAVPTAFYLYSLVSSCAKEDGTKEKERFAAKVKARDALRVVSPVFSSILSGMFVLIYLLFFILEGKYIFSALLGRLPDGFNVVDYARRGFFDLVGIMAINMVVFLVINTLEKRKSSIRISKYITMVLMGESIIFAVVALCKLLMYFTTFGYTPKRMLAMWGCVVMGAAAVFVIMNLIKAGDHARRWIIFTAASYVVMCLLAGIFILSDYRGNAPASQRDETRITFYNNTGVDIEEIEYSMDQYKDGEYERIDSGVKDFEEDSKGLYVLVMDGQIDYGEMSTYGTEYFLLTLENGDTIEIHESFLTEDPGLIEIYIDDYGFYRYTIDHK